MDDLIAFLKARIDEDEAAARAATDGPWRADPYDAMSTQPSDWFVGAPAGTVGIFPIDYSGPSNAAHIARHDPARVLREVEAKRRTIEVLVRRYKASKPGMAEGAHFVMLMDTLRLLALPYADHPDYREEWRA
jgi:hypothetical protein